MPNEFHRSTQRAIDIMRLVAGHNAEGLTMTELSSLLHAPKSSLFSIIHTLARNDILSLEAATGKYRLGIRVYLLAHAFLKEDHIQPAILREMERITAACRETCFFGVLDGGDVLYLLKTDSPEPLRMVTQGNKLPAYSTGIGKALLSGKTPEELYALYPDGLSPVTQNTITDMDELIRQLSRIRETDIAYENEESTQYVRCIGVPLRSVNGISAALSIAVPVFRYDEEKEKMMIALLRKAPETIGSLLWNQPISGLFANESEF